MSCPDCGAPVVSDYPVTGARRCPVCGWTAGPQLKRARWAGASKKRKRRTLKVRRD